MVKKYELYNEDCFSGMRRLIDEGRRFDLILTDPPYEIGVNGRGAFKKGRAMGRGELDFVASGFDYATCFSLFLELQEITNIIVFCSNAQISKTMQFFEERGISATLLMWHKTNPVPFTNNGYLSDVEFIVWARGSGAYFNNNLPMSHKSKVFRSGITPSNERIHPTQKRVDLLQRILNTHTQAGDSVLDPFSGSGSTGVACIIDKRRYVGFEINKGFFDKSLKRLEDTIREERNNLFYEE